MTSSAPSPRGPVWAHVGQAFAPRPYDVLILGAGRMGAACALYLSQLAPHLSVLLVEEGGLPNEEGATILAPGLWTALDVPAGLETQAEWTRAQLLSGLGCGLTLETAECPLIELSAQQKPGARQAAELLPPALSALVDVGRLPFATRDPRALRYRPAGLALQAAQKAVSLGTGLMLNARAEPQVGGARLHRLSVTNTHQVVVHESHFVPARAVVVAMGAAGPAELEYRLGRHSRHGRAYVQYPRLNLPSDDHTLALRVKGLTFRPQSGGFTLVPPLHHRDPQGYVPAGGQLTGVPTGLRREVLEDLVGLMDDLPALAGEGLELGRSLADVAGAWVALPQGRPDAPPVAEALGEGLHLLLGGPLADTLGLAAAYALAEQVAGDLAQSQSES